MVRTCANCGESFTASRGTYCGARACQNEKRRANYLARYGGAVPTDCENCGRPTATGGPKTTLRWCTDPDCQRAKRRWIWAARQSDPDSNRIEDRRCSSCDCRLPKRPWRPTDSELGRWCRKSKCQLARERTERVWMSTHRYWYDEMPAIECPECGLGVGVRKGFVHPHRDHIVEGKFVSCTAVGEQVPDQDLMEFAKADWNRARAELISV